MIFKILHNLFLEKIIFAQIWAKKAQNSPKIGFLDFSKNFVISFSKK